MDIINLFLILLSLVLAGTLVYFQYYHKQKAHTDQRILSVLRFFSFLGILLLFINPKFITRSYELIKPKIFIAVDNSASIAVNESGQIIREILNNLWEDKELNQRFELTQFKFGSTLNTDTVLDFKDTQTNINKAIEDLNAFSDQQKTTVVLLTDGNQTYGNSYTYLNSNFHIYPVVLGDTIPDSDLSISLVNINAYTTYKNNFSVEVFAVSKSIDQLESKLIIEKNGETVFNTPVSFSRDKRSQRIEFTLPADKIGMQLYTARIVTFEGEKNLNNNIYNFGIEVIDEKTKVALIHDIVHPDLGMIKRSIESNQQRQVLLMSPDDFIRSKELFSIHILYQPTMLFKEVFDNLHQDDRSYFIITGNNTDWPFLNSIQPVFSRKQSNVSEMYYPIYKNEFKAFYAPDIGFDNFPPLNDEFGEIKFSSPHDPMINQKINGVFTSEPLLTTYTQNTSRRVVLFGENLWKWRQYSYKENHSFEKFDQFFNSLIQYLHLSDRKQEIDLIYNPVYFANEAVSLKAKIYDSNLNIDKNSSLVVRLKGDQKIRPLHFRGNLYEALIEDLKPGKYEFDIEDLDSKKGRSGAFLVVPYSMEQEHSTANTEGLRLLASNNKGGVFYQDNLNNLKNELLNHADFKILEKEKIKLISLIDWKWLLGLIVLSLSLEWLIRKYRGLI